MNVSDADRLRYTNVTLDQPVSELVDKVVLEGHQVHKMHITEVDNICLVCRARAATIAISEGTG